jgi:aminobenzoyl-glutamate utilization protein B
VKNCTSAIADGFVEPFFPKALMSSRSHWIRLAGRASFAAALLFPTSLVAQRGGGGRGGGGGADNRPEVTFPVNLPPDDPKLAAMKKEAIRLVDSMSTFTQQMVDQVFSFGEPGFQEIETSKYLTGILEQHGFKVTRGVAGIPTAWVATWGSGKPVISLGSDIDDIPQASQKPGVGYKDPMVVGAPGHGEGHNAGVPMNITAAIAVKKIMEREHIPGTIHLWPGVAEELMAGKMYMVRAGVFKDVDAVLFAHISNGMGVSYGQSGQMALISAQFHFQGSSAHAAGAPWAGRSALDAVELMDVAWNFRREHLPLEQRSHYVITDGGDQPNVVPPTATVWYYFREMDSPKVQALFALADTIARAAAMMTGTKLSGVDIVGGGWSGHFNKVIAYDMYENIKAVGMPEYSEADQELARGIQRELGQTPRGLGGGGAGQMRGQLPPPPLPSTFRGGGSDDIGDVSWNVPTVTLRFPGNIPGLPGHNWANAIAMATPIAHKGATAGAKVQALTTLDLMTKPTLITQAWDYFRNVQTKDTKYYPLMRPEDKPPIWMNKVMMDKMRPEMRKFYYDPTKYKTYLEQLGIKYPTVRDTTRTVP